MGSGSQGKKKGVEKFLCKRHFLVLPTGGASYRRKYLLGDPISRGILGAKDMMAKKN